jgi:hypothetical protein
MYKWFAARAPDLAYEAYFSNREAGGVQSSLFRIDAVAFRTNVLQVRTASCSRPETQSAAVYRPLYQP